MKKKLKNIQTTTSSWLDCPYFHFKMKFTGGIEFQCEQIMDNSNGRLIPQKENGETFIHADCPLKDAREPGVLTGVSVILINYRKQILVGKRKNSSSGSGHWGLPGGGMDAGELPQETACREVKEETGIQIANQEELQFATFTNDCFIEESGEHWITLYYICREYNFIGKAERIEPHKCEEWRWVDLDNIPTPVFCNWAKNIDKLKAMVYYKDI